MLRNIVAIIVAPYLKNVPQNSHACLNQFRGAAQLMQFWLCEGLRDGIARPVHRLDAITVLDIDGSGGVVKVVTCIAVVNPSQTLGGEPITQSLNPVVDIAIILHLLLF